MTNMNDQYTNKSDNKEDGEDDVEDIDSGDKIVNYFNNGNNYNDDVDNDDEEDDDDNNRTWVMITMRTIMPIKEGDSLLQAVFLEEIIADKYFNFRFFSCIVQVNIQQLTLFVHRTQELKDRLDDDKEEDSMTQIMTFWFKCQPKLIHDYSLVGYILSPNPRIMNDARERMLYSPIYSDAIKRLIGKLLVPEHVTSTECKECLAEMTTKFFDEHQKFVNQTGILNSDTMWYIAGKNDFVVACCWHHTWMLSRNKVLGKLACLVLSKILGIGTAKRNWKQVKKIKYRDCANLGNKLTAKVTNI